MSPKPARGVPCPRGSGRKTRYGYYLITHPEGLADTAIALCRSWLIERFSGRARGADRPVQLAVSNA